MIVVSNIFDYSLELTVNSFYIPHRVLSNELFPAPVDPKTNTFFGANFSVEKLEAVPYFSSSFGKISLEIFLENRF